MLTLNYSPDPAGAPEATLGLAVTVQGAQNPPLRQGFWINIAPCLPVQGFDSEHFSLDLRRRRAAPIAQLFSSATIRSGNRRSTNSVLTSATLR
jgi:hypothetical protein